MTAQKVEDRIKTLFPECKDIRVARFVETHDIDTDETKIRVELTFTVPGTAVTE
jgi:hypothetical protein